MTGGSLAIPVHGGFHMETNMKNLGTLPDMAQHIHPLQAQAAKHGFALTATERGTYMLRREQQSIHANELATIKVVLASLSLGGRNAV